MTKAKLTEDQRKILTALLPTGLPEGNRRVIQAKRVSPGVWRMAAQPAPVEAPWEEFRNLADRNLIRSIHQPPSTDTCLEITEAGLTALGAKVTPKVPTHQPRRGDAVETWLIKHREDSWRMADHEGWSTINGLLDDYQARADSGQSLDD